MKELAELEAKQDRLEAAAGQGWPGAYAALRQNRKEQAAQRQQQQEAEAAELEGWKEQAASLLRWLEARAEGTGRQYLLAEVGSLVKQAGTCPNRKQQKKLYRQADILIDLLGQHYRQNNLLPLQEGTVQ